MRIDIILQIGIHFYLGNYVFFSMPLCTEIQWWRVAIQGHSGNKNCVFVCCFRNYVFFGMPSGSEIQRLLVAMQNHSGDQVRILLSAIMYFLYAFGI